MIKVLNGKRLINCIIENRGFIPLINERGPVLQPRLLEINVAKVLVVQGYDLVGIENDGKRVPLNIHIIRKIENGQEYTERKVIKEPIKNQEPKQVVHEQPKVQKVEKPKQEVKSVPDVPEKVEDVVEEPKQGVEVKPQQNNNNKKNKK